MKHKPKVGQRYIFDSAPQEAFDAWRRPVTLHGKHELVKQKDTFMDKLHSRSWYVADGNFLLFVPRGGYVEERCLQEVEGRMGDDGPN